MSSPIAELIARLKQAKAIRANPEFGAMMAAIDKFQYEGAWQAYLLGLFFRHKMDSDNLLPEEKVMLVNTIKKLHLESYFYLRSRPGDRELKSFNYLLALAGLFSLIAGIFQLMNGSFSYGLGTKYLLPVMREGGFLVILGTGLLWAGISKFCHDRQRKYIISLLER